ncbi:hypothetical protein ACFL27_12055 [candidate division CSSED10-310 bacterium]|uniref:EF-hand domain-containing protein n=1 Tax=candidate division CSSED10-310 bacterium TaxID=2855610 RepID=A0ABV6YXL4_UNCC1
MPGPKFRKLGGSHHLCLDKPEDLKLISELEEPFWMATSASINNFAGDKRLFEFLDTDNNKRIRCLEVKTAISWLFRCLRDHSEIGVNTDNLYLDNLDTSHEEGQRIKTAAERILININCPNKEIITLAQTRDRKTILAAVGTNGDGIIPPSATQDPAVQAFITDVMHILPGEMDASGTKGLTEGILQRYITESNKFLRWYGQGHLPHGKLNPDIFAWGNRTNDVHTYFTELEPKLDEYFLLCQASHYITSFETRVKPHHVLEPDPGLNNNIEAVLLELPLAQPTAEGNLDLSGYINPLYKEKFKKFVSIALEPLFRNNLASLTFLQWQLIKNAIMPYAHWMKQKPNTVLEKLGPEKLMAYAEGNYISAVNKLIERDEQIGQELTAIQEVEKLILFSQWLPRVVNNFVSFPELYDPTKRALFEWGTLILDGRTFRLCLPVQNRAQHKLVAHHSGIYLMYLKLYPQSDEYALEIAVAVTKGNAGRICVGKKGIFYSHDGHEFDAEVTEILENPISLIEAFFHPFKRLGEIVENQIEKIIGQSEKGLETALEKRSALVGESIEKMEASHPPSTQAEKRAPTVQSAITSPAQPGTERNFFRDMVVSLSLSVAAIGSSFAFITKMLSEVKLNHIIATLLACLAIILGPILILTLIKLHRRDIGMLLEASGWAINGRMRLTRKLSKMLSQGPLRKK